MKKFITAVAILASTSAYADTTVQGKILDHYYNVTNDVPRTHRDCYTVEVPVYGSNTSGGDVLGGMILGGLLGKGITGDDGGAAAGAILGGVIAGDKKRITGYRQEQRCDTVTIYEPVTTTQYSHSTIEFTIDGKHYTLEFLR